MSAQTYNPRMLIQQHVDLTPYNTFGLPARAARFAEATTVDEVRQAAALARGQRFIVMGGGSNIVLAGDLDAFVLRMAIPGRRLIDETADVRLVQCGAGESWHDIVRYTLDAGWPGLENLSLIPGTVGAAPIQNIGAYGVELADRFAWLDALELDSGSVVRFDREACAFNYRDSVFKREESKRYLIVSVTLQLPKHWVPELSYPGVVEELRTRGIEDPSPRDVSDAVIAIRQRKLPDWRVLGNAGSFFKNPVVPQSRLDQLLERFPELPHYPQPNGLVKLAAGWLIEQAGWRGVARGSVAVHERQALVLINRGGAHGSDVLALADDIAADVANKFGVRLDREPVLL
ncbi:MAG TPA: UDP-N-acetylmuramate dehydrogenase [Burkholderiaceae bacterium]|nr:UDP-N-acetylmuramate dehydrogenase [Burkholderiaceae bacterium]